MERITSNAKPLVSLIIVHCKGREILDACLESVFTQTYRPFEVILIDNGSIDGSVDYAHKRYPDMKIISNPSNIGFTPAVNTGIRQSEGTYIALLNDDAAVDKDWLASLVAAAQKDEKIGSCASKQMDFFKPDFFDAAGIRMHRGGFPIGRGRNQQDKGQFAGEEEVFAAHGASGFYRRRMLEEIGMFDSDYLIYNDEIDVAFRMQLAGWKCLYVPGAVLYHMGGQTWAAHDKKRLVFFTERNRIFTILKNYPLTMLFFFSPYLLKYEFDIWLRFFARLEIEPILARLAVFKYLARMLAKRRAVQENRAITDDEFKRLFTK